MFAAGFEPTLHSFYTVSAFGPLISRGVQHTDLITPARKSYSGPLEAGEDLMTIDIGESVTIRRTSGVRLNDQHRWRFRYVAASLNSSWEMRAPSPE